MSVSSSSSLAGVLQSPLLHSELYGKEHSLTVQQLQAKGTKKSWEGKVTGKTSAPWKASNGHVSSRGTVSGRRSKSTAGVKGGSTTGSARTGLTNSHSSTPGSSGKVNRISTSSATKDSTKSGNRDEKGRVDQTKGTFCKDRCVSSEKTATILTAKDIAHTCTSSKAAWAHFHRPASSSWSLAQVEVDSPQTTKKRRHKISQFSTPPPTSGRRNSTMATGSQQNMLSRESRGRVRGAWGSGSGRKGSFVKLTPGRVHVSAGKCNDIRTSTEVGLLSKTDSVSTIHLSHPPTPSLVTGSANRRLPGASQGCVNFSRWNQTSLTSQLPSTLRIPRRNFATTLATRGWGQGQRQLQLGDIAAGLGRMHYKSIIVMSGAGISTPSGIPDFRTPGTGLYDNLQKYQLPEPTAVFDTGYFHHNPRPFFTLAKELYPGRFSPNLVHCFVRLLQDKGVLLRNYTQNIDGLERLAGVRGGKLVEAHGSFSTASCIRCHSKQDPEEVKRAIFSDQIPKCKHKYCNGVVKPDIVFFGEDLPQRFHSLQLPDFSKCDLLLVMGTSLEVEPFASLITLLRHTVPRVLLNRELVGPFRSSRCRHTDVAACGDIVESVNVVVQGAGWGAELEEIQQRLSEESGFHAVTTQLHVAVSSSPSASSSSGDMCTQLTSALGRLALQDLPDTRSTPQTPDSDSSESSSSLSASSLFSDSSSSESD